MASSKSPRVTVRANGTLDPRAEYCALLLSQGLSITDIATELPVCRKWATALVRHPAIERRAREIAEARVIEVNSSLARMVPRALDRFEKQLDAAEAGELNFSQERQIIESVLDRGGLPRQSAAKVQHTNTNTLDASDIQRLTDMGRELLASGALAEVDFFSMGQRLSVEYAQAI